MAFPSTAKVAARLTIAATTTLSMAAPAYAFFPFITDDTGTQGAGGNQIEITHAFNKNHNTVVNENGDFVENLQGTSNAFPLTYTRGIGENVDLFVGIARQNGPIAGWQNSEIGLKWVFVGDQSQGWSAAIKPTLKLPVSTAMQDKGLGSAKTNLDVTFISSYMTDRYEWHFNAGYASNRQKETPDAEAERQNIWSISVAPVLVINPQWKVGVDVGLQTNPIFNSKYGAFGEVGLTYEPMKNLQVGLGVIFSPDINAQARAYSHTLTTGLAYQF